MQRRRTPTASVDALKPARVKGASANAERRPCLSLEVGGLFGHSMFASLLVLNCARTPDGGWPQVPQPETLRWIDGIMY